MLESGAMMSGCEVASLSYYWCDTASVCSVWGGVPPPPPPHFSHPVLSLADPPLPLCLVAIMGVSSGVGGHEAG